MKNNMKRAFIGILAASLAAASLTGCALLDKPCLETIQPLKVLPAPADSRNKAPIPSTFRLRAGTRRPPECGPPRRIPRY